VTRVLALLVALAPLGACVVTDADLAGGALDTLTAAPDASAVNTFTVGVTGTATVQYTSPEPAVLDITVDGAQVIEQGLDVSAALTAAIDATVPLHEGPNEIVVAVTYQGETLTERFVVDAAMDPPTITGPVWGAPAYTAHQGLDVGGTITVAADAAYAVADVAVSVDGEPWIPATSAGGATWTVTIPDPDIGDSDVAIRVTTAVDGHTAETTAHATLTVAPIFDCAAAGSMLPTTDLLRNNGTENRIMAGYFGHPDGGHDVSFALTSAQTQFGTVTVLSSTTGYGLTEIHASWIVSSLRCDTGGGSCTIPYSLVAYVDGVQLCAQGDFGNITSRN